MNINNQLQHLRTHSNFVVYRPKQILEHYAFMFAQRIIGRNLRRGLNWERFFNVEMDDIVVDVGAWPGEFVSSIAGTASKIVAIEPEPHNFSELNRIFKTFSNVIVIKKAAWNRKQKLPLYMGNEPSDHSLFPDVRVGNIVSVFDRSLIVEADTLDNIVSDLRLDGVDFLKMNIEGAELEALEGAKSLLRKLTKIVVASHHIIHRRKTLWEVEEILNRNGFRTWVAYHDCVYGYKPCGE